MCNPERIAANVSRIQHNKSLLFFQTFRAHPDHNWIVNHCKLERAQQMIRVAFLGFLMDESRLPRPFLDFRDNVWIGNIVSLPEVVSFQSVNRRR